MYNIRKKEEKHTASLYNEIKYKINTWYIAKIKGVNKIENISYGILWKMFIWRDWHPGFNFIE